MEFRVDEAVEMLVDLNVELVERLLESGEISVDTLDCHGDNLASYADTTELLELMLRHGATAEHFNRRNDARDGRTAFEYMCKRYMNAGAGDACPELDVMTAILELGAETERGDLHPLLRLLTDHAAGAEAFRERVLALEGANAALTRDNANLVLFIPQMAAAALGFRV